MCLLYLLVDEIVSHMDVRSIWFNRLNKFPSPALLINIDKIECLLAHSRECLHDSL